MLRKGEETTNKEGGRGTNKEGLPIHPCLRMTISVNHGGILGGEETYPWFSLHTLVLTPYPGPHSIPWSSLHTLVLTPYPGPHSIPWSSLHTLVLIPYLGPHSRVLMTRRRWMQRWQP